jgi:hypothetical protein
MRWLQIKNPEDKYPVIGPIVWPTPKYTYRVVQLNSIDDAERLNVFAKEGYRVAFVAGYERVIMEKETYDV